jgi:hypothetical protein
MSLRLLLFACASPAAVLGAIDQRLVAEAAAAGMSTVATSPCS